MKITALKDKINKYQHLKVTFWIAVVAIITLIVSFIACSPWNSILQNVFAGLVTGLVITLIGSLKGKELKDTELERDFMISLHDQYLTENKQFREFRKYRKAEADDYFGALYDLASEMYAIEAQIEQEDRNELLIQVLGQKPSEFFKDKADYDFEALNKTHKDVAVLLDSRMSYPENVRKEIDEKLTYIRGSHHKLNHCVFNRIYMLQDQKTEIERSVP